MSKKSNTSKRYTAEFKRDAVALVHSSDKPVTEVAREIGVSPEGLRNWVNQDKTDRGQGPVGALTTAEREELARLRRKGRSVNRKKVERLMREHDIRGITRRKRRNLTKADRKAAPSPHLVGRDFTAAEPGTKLVSDTTYLPTLAGWWYLATVIDLATREVIGYAMAGHHRAGLVTDALKMAVGRGALKPGCIAHSDRGSEGEFNWSSQHFDLGGVRRGHGGLEFEDQRCSGGSASAVAR
ncbi:transposase [Streptomyces goshikiensis]|uniref:transposase n=1 Tax=Streptomyces goshikiensis TaxID=1942 RepID=UPI0036C970B1